MGAEAECPSTFVRSEFVHEWGDCGGDNFLISQDRLEKALTATTLLQRYLAKRLYGV